MNNFGLIALTAPGSLEPAIAIAASRAGAMGVLDLEFVCDYQAAWAATAKLARYTSGTYGIKLDGETGEHYLMASEAALPDNLGLIILTAARPNRLQALVRHLRHPSRTILLEARSVEHAQLGEDVGVDGFIAKGHEAGGFVGDDTTFILLQRLLSRTSLPVWAHGGISVHTAPACWVAGAAGAVLDAQLLFTPESPLAAKAKAIVSRMDGSETVCLGESLQEPFRVYTQPNFPIVAECRELESQLVQQSEAVEDRREPWREVLRQRIGAAPEAHCLWPVGQDIAFAATLAQQYHNVSGILNAIRRALSTYVQTAVTLRPFDTGAALAQAHGTAFPIVQGPMTRVSDRAEFALEVATAGALPFLALALMRGSEADTLLNHTRHLLGDKPWGVGILGFVPLQLRQEQMEVVRRYRPPFVLIAGGRPDQARALEQDGIVTYLHVPSPGLLRLFIQNGARRFVFEGRECGGHVGPRSSFVLWSLMTDILLELLTAETASDYHILFAGGIHDARSAAMVATIAAPLAERGVRVGVLLGTAYLFTYEAVSSGAIQPAFQDEALKCHDTVLLETGPGHAVRCVPTPYAEEFARAKQQIFLDGLSAEEGRLALEQMNLGRLRIASKGIARNPQYGRVSGATEFLSYSDDLQRRQGMYMIGQAAALQDRQYHIEELHREVAIKGAQWLGKFDMPPSATPSAEPTGRPAQVAIVGMSCILPKAQNLRAYWENILNRVDSITEIPKERWDSDLYFDENPRATDKIYSKWGGFIDDVPFDPLEFGMPPNTLPSIDPLQLIALLCARDALSDAGYLKRDFDRSRTSVILGASGGTGELGGSYLLRSSLPLLFGDVTPDIIDKTDGTLPEWTEDSFAGLLLNVTAGRISNRFDLGGLNFVVDAACASSLAAVHLAVKELLEGSSEMVLVGGGDTTQNPFGYLCFSKTHALSPTGEARTFDADANGITISEGYVMLVLKRLADAERDGDRIYAVVQGVAGSSDGKDRGLTAPRPEGQKLALHRTYTQVGIDPTSVRLFEAHGTGTVVGDRIEALSLTEYLEAAGAAPQSYAIGSVKSMIGHTKAAAGVAGLAKVALALYHQVLPPTLRVKQPNTRARLDDGPLYVNSETRPWLQSSPDEPRRAGVSSFGFGGTNFHAIVEEYTQGLLAKPAVSQNWPTELLLWVAPSRQALRTRLEQLEVALTQGAQPVLRDLAYTLWEAIAASPTDSRHAHLRLAMVASSVSDLHDKLHETLSMLEAADPAAHKVKPGIYYTETPFADDGKVAFLFPGQGSQYPNMLRDLAIHFAEVREGFERVDAVLATHFAPSLSSYIFPPPAFTQEAQQEQKDRLTNTHVAQPALGAADMALCKLLQQFGVCPDMVAGHSYGEYVALCAAGVFDPDTLAALSEFRGRSIVEAAEQDLGTMAAVQAEQERVSPIVDELQEVWLSNLNAPQQTIISGTQAGIDEAIVQLKKAGLRASQIPVAAAFHSPIVAPARERLAGFLRTLKFAMPHCDVFANATAEPYPKEPEAIVDQLAEHLVKPVRFVDEIRAMYDAGARLFVEVGPRNVLTGLVQRILGDTPVLALAMDAPGRDGLTQLQQALGQLAVHGASVGLDRLFQGRDVRLLDMDRLVDDTRPAPLTPTTWLVNGGRARPMHQPVAAVRPPALSSLNLESVNGVTAPMTASPSHEPVPEPAVRTTESQEMTPGQAARPAQASLPAQMPVVPGDSARVMMHYQRVMDRFLTTQRNVMLTYLQGTSNPSPPDREHAPEAPGLLHDAPSVQHGNGVSLPADAQSETIVSPTPPRQEEVEVAPRAEAQTDEVVPGASDAKMDAEQLTHQLLQIVSDRTGYPPEMLDLDVDIEANLGIDSIKRVEILGAMQQLCLPSDAELDAEVMEQLTSIKTLRGIVDWLQGNLQPADGATPEAVQVAYQALTDEPSTPSSTPEPVVNGAAPASITRAQLAMVQAPPGRLQPPRFTQDHVVLITDDGQGLARAMMEPVRQQGARPILICQGTGLETLGIDTYQTDLGDPDLAAECVRQVREQQGAIGGFLHLKPLQDRMALENMTLVEAQARLRLEMKSLFYVVRAAAEDLKQAGKSHGAYVVAATGLGGSYREASGDQAMGFPGQGGIAGLLKSLAMEWPDVRCKAIGLDLDSSIADLTQQLCQEIGSDDEVTEVYYPSRNRCMLQPKLAPLMLTGQPSMAIGSDWVILITGGARGITAEVACELAERYQLTLLITGRSALPEGDEMSHTQGLTSPQEIKAALMQHLREMGEPVDVPKVERAYAGLQRDREIRRNLDRMRQAHATVRYFQVDARDEAAMTRLISTLYQEYGRLDGVIHGAGVIEDKLIEEKTPDSFDRVFDTKVTSALILSQALRAETLRFLVLFASAAGTFGNRGQGDYAAANEVLNQLARHLDQRWTGRVVAINWGPWATAGMVSPELEREFAKRGIHLIPLDEGRRICVDELLQGAKGETSIVVASGTWGASATHEAISTDLPLIHGLSQTQGSGDTVDVIYNLNPSTDLYLQDHCIDGTPVFPFVMAMELMAEVVQLHWPDLQIVEVHDLRMLKGVVLEQGPKSLRVVAKPHVEPAHEHVGLNVHVQIIDTDGTGRICYQGTMALAEQLPAPPSYTSPFIHGLKPFRMTPQESYHEWLFHGPLFHGIRDIEGIETEGMIATLMPSSPKDCLLNSPHGSWIIDPVVVDSGLQLSVLWGREILDKTPLPSRLSRYYRYGSLDVGPIQCHLHVTDISQDPIMFIDVAFLGPDGRLLGLLKDMEGISSKALNRLSSNPARV